MAIQSSYNKPDVTIIQQVVSPSITLAEPSLYPCFVGMAYRVIEDSSAGAYDGTGAAITIPELVSTDTLEASSLVVKAVKGDYTNTLPDTDYTATSTTVTLDNDVSVERVITNGSSAYGISDSSSAIFTDASATFISWGLAAGDKITITSGLDIGEHVISTVDSETQVTFTVDLTTVQSNLDHYAIKVDYIGTGLGSTIYVSYRALRSDLDTVTTIASRDDATSTFGIFDTPDNPLGFAVFQAFLNGDTKIKVLGVTADTLSAYSTALATLESEDVYSIVPLSQLFSVVSAAKTHCTSMSAPAEKRERISICSINLYLRSLRLASTDATITADSGNIYVVSRPGASFLTNGVVNGDVMYPESVTEFQVAPAIGYVVREVTSENAIKVEYASSIIGAVATFTVTSSTFTKQQQAEHIRDLASSVEEKRVSIVWPDQDIVSPRTTSSTVPGYYRAAAVAAAIASLPAQQGFTKLRVSGFDNLVHSNIGYFTNSQLDTIASGGVMIFTQQTSGAIPEIRHQLTTNMSAIEYRELSIVKNVDYIAKYLRERLSTYIGRWNIHEFFLSALKVTIQGVFEALKNNDDISGPNITSASIVSIEQNSANPDRVDVVVDLGVPYPANDIRVTLRI